jgi:nicotinamide mononucleotide transporter
MNPLEIIVSIITIIGVILTTRQSVWVWPINIISVSLLIWLYLENSLFGQASLQFLCLIPCIIGWFNWGKGTPTPIRKIKDDKFFYDMLFFSVLGVLFGYSLLIIGTLISPYVIFLDSIAAFIGLLANWYLSRKILQVWKVFMVYNLLIIILMYSQGLYLIVLLNMVLFLLSIKGYKTWKKDLAKA